MALALTLLSMTVLSCVPVTANPVSTTGQGAPLFINLTSDEPHRVNMALSFGMKQLDRGHPLTVFLNDRGVLHVGSTANADQFAEQQKTIATLLEKGARGLHLPDVHGTLHHQRRRSACGSER